MTAELRILPTDAAVLAMLRRGEEGGLVHLYRACQPAIRSYVLRNSGTLDDADDVLQESVIVLWERIRSGTFEQTARLETFIMAVARNLWLRRLARKRREPAQDPSDTGSLADPAGSPVDLLMDEEQTAAIVDALNRLGEPCKTLLVLYYYEERSMREIADRMGFANADTAKSKKYQCKKALQGILATQ
jgi:RNA polymerase sigma factor (sigma-70 family)